MADSTFYGVSATIPVGDESTGVGTEPSGVAVDEVTGTAYVGGHDVVSVIDEATNGVTATIALDDSPSALAVNPLTDMIYAVSAFNGPLSVIDGATDSVVTTIPVGEQPVQVAVNTATNTIYVTNARARSITVIDGGTNTVQDSIQLGTDPEPNGVAVDPTTNTVYVADRSESSLLVIDGSTDEVINSIDVGDGPGTVAFDSAAGEVYVANLDGTVSVVDTASDQVVDTVTVGGGLVGLAIDASAGLVYATRGFDGATDNSANSVSVIDESTDTVTATVAVGNDPLWVAVDPETGDAYVSNLLSDTVSVISAGSSPGVGGRPPAGRMGVRYSYQFQTSGFPSPTVSLSDGSLPPGLSLSHAGVLSGIPRAAGRWSFVVTASNGVGQDASEGVTISVAPAAHQPRADLAVSLAAPGRVRHGRLLTATVTVTDNGPDAAQAVATTLFVPQGLMVTRTGGGTPVRSGLRFVQRGLPRASSRTYVVTLVAARGARGPRQLTAQTGSAIADPNQRNNSSTVTVSIR